MNIKKLNKPLILRKYEVVRARLRSDFPRFSHVEREYRKILKGYKGEKKVNYYLEFLAAEFTILQDVYLKIDGKNFQLDNIIISQHAIYIVDVKNYSGTIIFDTILDQFIRDDGNKETGFSHPVTQVENQKLKLQNWLHHNGHTNIPIYSFVAISEPATLIKVVGDSEKIARVVGHGEQIPNKILDIEKQLSNNNKIIHQKVGHTILRNCGDFDMDIMADHGIKRTDLKPGLRCISCGWVGMEKKKTSWYCTKCNYKDKFAFLTALEDYFILFNSKITNKECREFLNENSRHVITRILKKSPLIYDPLIKGWTKK